MNFNNQNFSHHVVVPPVFCHPFIYIILTLQELFPVNKFIHFFNWIHCEFLSAQQHFTAIMMMIMIENRQLLIDWYNHGFVTIFNAHFILNNRKTFISFTWPFNIFFSFYNSEIDFWIKMSLHGVVTWY